MNEESLYQPDKTQQKIELPMLQYEEILLFANKYHELSDNIIFAFDCAEFKKGESQFISIDVNKLIQIAKKELTNTLEANGLYANAEFVEVRK